MTWSGWSRGRHQAARSGVARRCRRAGASSARSGALALPTTETGICCTVTSAEACGLGAEEEHVVGLLRAGAHDDAGVDGAGEARRVDRGAVGRRLVARHLLLADVEVDARDAHVGGAEDVGVELDVAARRPARRPDEPHAERRPRIVDDGLVLAHDVALRVVAHRAQPQAADVEADVQLRRHRAPGRRAVPHAVDEERQALDGLGGDDGHLQRAGDEAGGLLDDANGLRRFALGERARGETDRGEQSEQGSTGSAKHSHVA